MSGAQRSKKIEAAWDNVGTLLADGLDAMLLEDWNEVESDTDQIPYNPDWDRAFALERQGILKVLSARRAGLLIGVNCFMVMDYFHSRGVLHAFNDLIYVAPHYRGIAGPMLVRHAERLLAPMGVRRIFYSAKVKTPKTGAFFEAMGYYRFEKVFAKVMK